MGIKIQIEIKEGCSEKLFQDSNNRNSHDK